MTLSVQRGGHAYVVEDTDVTASWGFWDLWSGGKWEPAMLAKVDEALPEGGRLLDIGAWVGPVTLWAARRAYVTALEPDPLAFDLLQRNVALNKMTARVRLLEQAAGPANGVINIGAQGERWGTSASSTVTGKIVGERLEVAMVDASALLDNVDLCKIDIEGGELTLLPALGLNLRRRGIPMIFSYHWHMYDGDEGLLLAELEHWSRTPLDGDTYYCEGLI